MIPFWKKTGKDGKKKPQKPAVPQTAQQSIPMQRMFEDVFFWLFFFFYTCFFQK